MRGIARGEWLPLIVLLTVVGLGLALAEQQEGTLVVSGHSGQAPVTHVNGRAYVAVDALAGLLNGSVNYRGNEIILTLPHAASGAANQPATRKLSRNFLNSGIETMSDIREWRSALLVAIRNGYGTADLPVVMDPYQAKAAKNLRLASVAATTASDRDALQLLDKELSHMQQLNNKIVEARKNASYITVDSVENDPLDQKILKCAHALGEMAASGEFQDNGACH
jgi:hypothetical protein